MRTEQSQLEARYDGVVKLENADGRQAREGCWIVMNRHGEIVIVDETGRERERYGLTYGASCTSARATSVKPGAAPVRVGPVRDADPHRGRRAS